MAQCIHAQLICLTPVTAGKHAVGFQFVSLSKRLFQEYTRSTAEIPTNTVFDKKVKHTQFKIEIELVS